MYQLVLQTSYAVSFSSSKGNSRHLSPRVEGEGEGGGAEDFDCVQHSIIA